jgi:hypothetical protein
LQTVSSERWRKTRIGEIPLDVGFISRLEAPFYNAVGLVVIVDGFDLIGQVVGWAMRTRAAVADARNRACMKGVRFIEVAGWVVVRW